MQEAFTRYINNQLPKGFKYPDKYLKLSEGINFPKKFSWWFEDATTESGRLAWLLRNSKTDWQYMRDINPIPFAQLNDWKAFFDGNDKSGNPKVIVIDLGNKTTSYEVDSFDTWLDTALKD